MVHTLEKHLTAIDSLCRLCAQVAVTQKHKKSGRTPYQLDKLRKELTPIGFVFRTDNEGEHSRSVCHKCKHALNNSKQRESVTAIDKLRKCFQD